MLWSNPATRSLVLALRVEVLDVNIRDSWADIREAPRDALVVSDDYVWHPGQRDACDIHATRAQVRFVPQVGHLVAEVHIVGKQRLAGHGVRAGDHPVIRSIHWLSFGKIGGVNLRHRVIGRLLIVLV